MKKLTYLDSLKKVNEKIKNDDLIKQLHIEIVKFSIEKKDYQGLVKKTASIFDIDVDDALLLINDVSTDNTLSESWASIGTELNTYLKLISITYGESIYEVKIYATSENKLQLAESYLSIYESKLGVDLKRVDGEHFYMEMNLGSMVAFTGQVIDTFTDMIKRGKFPDNDMAAFENALQLREGVTYLAHAIGARVGEKEGDTTDDGTN